MVKTKITDTLKAAKEGLACLKDDFFIIGACSTILSDIDTGNTNDIDILVTSEDADRLKPVWKDKIEKDPALKESELFKSNFTRYNFPKMDIEVLGDLLIFKNGNWEKVAVNHYATIDIDGFTIKIPTLEEQIRILHLFGRKKDLERLDIISKTLHF